MIAAALLARIALLLIYQPVTFPDTGTYQSLAAQWRNLDFSEYQGLRTPGYAYLLLLAGQDHFAVWLIQSALGIVTASLLFWICLVHTGSPLLALCAGLAHALAINQLFLEAAIVSETLSAFLVVLCVAGLVASIKTRAHGTAAGCGFAAGAAAVTRPLYVYIGPLFALLIVAFERDGKKRAAALLLAFSLPVLALAMLNKVTVGYFGLSTMIGYNLTNHSGRFIERAGEEYATIREVYLAHREERIAESGTSAMTIFTARAEMMERTGLDVVALSRRLTALSVGLFVQHPASYVRSVGEAWASFWTAPMYWDPASITVDGWESAITKTFSLQRAAFLVFNLLVIVTSAYVIMHAIVRRWRGVYGLSIPLVIACVVMAASVVQALLEFGENGRYAIPTQSLGVTLVLLAAWDWRLARRSGSSPLDPQVHAVR